jgi:hypothetical protein
MASPAVRKTSRVVLCRHCGKPVRVPALVSKKETDFQSRNYDDMTYHLVSRVFVLRCRACERESVYSMDQIVDYAMPATMVVAESNASF